MSRRYKHGTARSQNALLPPRIEDYISENNAVRAIDAYIDTLDLKALGFQNASGGRTAGQPAFDPAALLKLYVVGYINRVHSSRRLARECHRNLEVIWLLEGLTPSYRTIADFRKVNGPALKAACKEFIALCKELELLGGEEVALDGAFFNANASAASVTTKKQMEKDLKQIELDIDAYYQGLDTQDEQESGWGEQLGEASALGEKLKQLQARQARTQAQLKQLEARGETQLSRTDPDA
ncbi:transposase, partial [Sedimenticola hydrogenitrophicus]|uniref:transposase n=1 Tax=Sedimenticola hydrogenitrophicus TaxID=2967975 RepID=UPI0021A3F6D3